MTEKQPGNDSQNQETIQLLEDSYRRVVQLKNKAQRLRWSLKKCNVAALLALINQVEDESGTVADMIATRIIKLGKIKLNNSGTHQSSDEGRQPVNEEPEVLGSLETAIETLREQALDAAEAFRAFGDEKASQIMNDLYSASGKWLWRIKNLQE